MLAQEKATVVKISRGGSGRIPGIDPTGRRVHTGSRGGDLMFILTRLPLPSTGPS